MRFAMHSKIAILFFAALLLFGSVSDFGQLSAADANRPNVLLVITDDQGYGDIGFHGNPVLKTPNLDALARQSLRLTNYHSDPTCAETRCALMTGRYPLRGGVWHTVMGRSIMSSTAVTMPQLFKAAGYRTGLFGKWHLGDNYPYRPQDRGFDTTLHLGGGGVTQMPDVWGNDYFDDVYWSRDKLQPVRGYCTDAFFGAATEFVTAKSNEPFFCYIATNAPHSPYYVDEAFKKPYIEQGISEPMASFYGMIANFDQNLGKLLNVLEQKGLADNTIVVFITDNGSAAGYIPAKPTAPDQGFNANMRGIKGTQYEGGHRVPCFIRYPKKLPTDQEFGKLCAHMDILPTLAGLCSVDLSSAPPLDGRDLGPFVRNEKPWPERTLVVQSHRVAEPVMWRKSAVMTERWRLVDGTELYDMNEDAGQKNNVASSNSGTVSQLRAAYEKWWLDMSPDPKQLSRIAIGADAAPRVRLTAHDWYSPTPVVMQENALKDPAARGAWAVSIKRPGAYQFLLSRRPLSDPAPIEAMTASVKLTDVDGKVLASRELKTDPTVVVAPITLELPSGDAFLDASFLKGSGDTVGAYFVTANYLGDVRPQEIDATEARLPGWLKPGDRVAWLGGTLIERLGDTGALDAEVLLRSPLAGLSFVNLGWSGDDFSGRGRGVFGGLEEGRKRRLRDLQLSGASVVVVAYGMSELLDSDFDETQLQGIDGELRSMLAEVRALGKRLVLALPPALTVDKPNSRELDAICDSYEKHRPMLSNLLKTVAKDHSLPVVELGTITTSMFESGTYLGKTGYSQWATTTAEKLFSDAKSPANASRAQEAELARLAKESNRLFFDMIRPQNETYLLLFRKHEQGNNAVEMGQYRPLLAEVQLDLNFVAASANP